MANDSKKGNGVRRIAGAILLGVLYYATARAGLGLGAVSGFAALVWPPTGIALAALFLWGPRFWPAVAAGAFFANYHTGASLLVALGIAAGNAGEAALGAYLLKWRGFKVPVERVKDAADYLVFACIGATLVSPSLGVTSLFAGGVVPASAFGITWFSWWVGDVLGALVVGALIILTVGAIRTKYRLRQPVEALALLVALVVVSAAVFTEPFGIRSGSLPIAYMVFVPLLWAALRFGPLGSAVASLVVSVIAMWGTLHGFGPFVRGSVVESLLFLQLFMGVVAGTKFLVAAESAERHRAEADLRAAGKGLEKKVSERTAELTKANETLEHAKAILEKRGAVLQAVLHGIGEGVAAFDVSGNPIVVNQWAMKLTGMSLTEGSSQLDKMADNFPLYYTDGEARVPFGDLPATRALRGEVTNNERLILKSPGNPKGILISISGSPIRGERGAIIGGVVVFREIPE